MDFRRPISVITPTLDGDVLVVLARVDGDLTGEQIHSLIGHSTSAGVRKAAARLVEQGIVQRRAAGRAHLYKLNRDHVAAPWIEHLADLTQEVIRRLRKEIRGWRMRPKAAVLFGSVARGEATSESDLDLMVIRPSSWNPSEERWRDQLVRLEQLASSWTGNDARVLEIGEAELARPNPPRVVSGALRDGIFLYGNARVLSPAARRI